MKVFNKNSVSVFPSTFIDGQVHYKNIIHFLEHFWLDVFVAVVRFFLFPKWCLSFLRSNEQRTRPQHLSGTCYLLGLSPGTQKEGSKGVNWSAVFCSVVCQSHQRKWTSVRSWGANSWSHWSQWDLHRKFPGNTPIHFYEIRIWPY